VGRDGAKFGSFKEGNVAPNGKATKVKKGRKVKGRDPIWVKRWGKESNENENKVTTCQAKRGVGEEASEDTKGKKVKPETTTPKGG